MQSRSQLKAIILLLLLSGLLVVSSLAQQKLDENCTVSVLNRNVQVNHDGTWQLPNVPAGFNRVRARVTCVNDGNTSSGESNLFTITPNRMNAIKPIAIGPTTPIPNSLTITSQASSLAQVGQATQLTVTASYADGTTSDITAASSGTIYTISNPAIAT